MFLRTSRLGYYLDVVRAVAMRGTCDRGRAGAIIVKEGRIISTGYAGAPTGLPHCDEAGHDLLIKDWGAEQSVNLNFLGTPTEYSRYTEHCIRTVHAEANAIIQAAKYGPPINASVIYCTMFPCFECAKMIVNAGIIEVISQHGYQTGEKSKELFDEVGIPYQSIDEEAINYSKK